MSRVAEASFAANPQLLAEAAVGTGLDAPSRSPHSKCRRQLTEQVGSMMQRLTRGLHQVTSERVHDGLVERRALNSRPCPFPTSASSVDTDSK